MVDGGSPGTVQPIGPGSVHVQNVLYSELRYALHNNRALNSYLL